MKLSHRSLATIALLLASFLVLTLVFTKVSRAQTPAPEPAVTINQLILDPATGRPSQLILFDGGMGNQPLQNLALLFVNSSDRTILATYPITETVTDQDGFFTMAVPTPAAMLSRLSRAPLPPFLWARYLIQPLYLTWYAIQQPTTMNSWPAIKLYRTPVRR